MHRAAWCVSIVSFSAQVRQETWQTSLPNVHFKPIAYVASGSTMNKLLSSSPEDNKEDSIGHGLRVYRRLPSLRNTLKAKEHTSLARLLHLRTVDRAGRLHASPYAAGMSTPLRPSFHCRECTVSHWKIFAQVKGLTAPTCFNLWPKDSITNRRTHVGVKAQSEARGHASVYDGNFEVRSLSAEPLCHQRRGCSQMHSPTER